MKSQTALCPMVLSVRHTKPHERGASSSSEAVMPKREVMELELEQQHETNVLRLQQVSSTASTRIQSSKRQLERVFNCDETSHNRYLQKPKKTPLPLPKKKHGMPVATWLAATGCDKISWQAADCHRHYHIYHYLLIGRYVGIFDN